MKDHVMHKVGGWKDRANLIDTSRSIQALGQRGRWTEALGVFLSAGHNALEYDIVFLNILLGTLCARGVWPAALGMLAETVDVCGWNTLLQGSGRAQSWAFTLDALEHMACTVGTDETSFNTAIASVKVWQLAASILAEMSQARLRSDVLGHTAAVSACVPSEDDEARETWRQAVSQLGSMAAASLSANPVTWGACISSARAVCPALSTCKAIRNSSPKDCWRGWRLASQLLQARRGTTVS